MINTIAVVTFEDGTQQELSSKKSPVAYALDDIKEQVIRESDFWFKKWHNITISLERIE